MNILGRQKSSFIDYPNKISTVYFTGGCNFKCPYCHNKDLVNSIGTKFSEDEIFSFLLKRKKFIDAVCISGGEPTLQKDLYKFISKLKSEGFFVKLDTNGYRPDVLEPLIKDKMIDYIAMDIKNDLTTYLRTIGLEKQHEESVKQLGDIDIHNDNSVKQSPLSLLERVKESISIIMATSEANYLIDYEFRTTFVPGLHSIDSAKGIGELIRGAKIFYVQNFRPGKTLDPLYLKKNGFTDSDLKSFADTISKYVDEVVIR